jgi:diacylglycerol O-acyltransferase-1
MIRPWSFLAMMIQLPIGLVVKRVRAENKTYGNIAVWISLILIQPIAILLYIQDLFYRDFVKINSD